jgi:MFS superfamily sulfate permease-like transporter
MPSVHVGWALIVAFAVITVSRSRWRWLAAGYPLLTLLVVVVTANHFWLDGIAAGLLVAAVLAAQRLMRMLRSGKSSESAQVTSVNREMSMRS